jgi:hypothetical protein
LLTVALDRIQHAGGFISVNTSGNIDANTIPINKKMLMKHLMRQRVLVAELV